MPRPGIHACGGERGAGAESRMDEDNELRRAEAVGARPKGERRGSR
ncbi:hypothetical protein [Actinomadura chokoriensis]|uniref:Uncharacterized protein n=1 Tax=Actinomadura chokoriensis TaxID=454156 RepID=A0ABV4R781_9ACTN